MHLEFLSENFLNIPRKNEKLFECFDGIQGSIGEQPSCVIGRCLNFLVRIFYELDNPTI